MPIKGSKTGTRNIIVEYFADRRQRDLVRRSCAKHSDKAIANALRHMWSDHYPGARYVVIYDAKRGRDLARIAPSSTGFSVIKES